MICKQCGAENADSCAYCVGCGTSLSTPQKKKHLLPILLVTAVVIAAAIGLFRAALTPQKCDRPRERKLPRGRYFSFIRRFSAP